MMQTTSTICQTGSKSAELGASMCKKGFSRNHSDPSFGLRDRLSYLVSGVFFLGIAPIALASSGVVLPFEVIFRGLHRLGHSGDYKQTGQQINAIDKTLSVEKKLCSQLSLEREALADFLRLVDDEGGCVEEDCKESAEWYEKSASQVGTFLSKIDKETLVRLEKIFPEVEKKLVSPAFNAIGRFHLMEAMELIKKVEEERMAFQELSKRIIEARGKTVEMSEKLGLAIQGLKEGDLKQNRCANRVDDLKKNIKDKVYAVSIHKPSLLLRA